MAQFLAKKHLKLRRYGCLYKFRSCLSRLKMFDKMKGTRETFCDGFLNMRFVSTLLFDIRLTKMII